MNILWNAKGGHGPIRLLASEQKREYFRPKRVFLRPFDQGQGQALWRYIPECTCGTERRGPEGGICWCGGAIPSQKELQIST